MTKVLSILAALAAIFLCQSASAQYYSWGADAPSFRWSRIGNGDFSVVYPDTLEHVARRTARYIEAVRPSESYGFRYGPLPKMPFVVHPENFRSNGLTMWLPKRIDYLAIPDDASYSMPWLKQLAAHEYRHTVQYNDLNRGVARVLSWFLGQQGSTVGLIFLPLWVIEGDATLFETQVSTFGRGLQPSFTMEYRAMGRDLLSRRNIDKWFCGSYRDNIPNHYNLGYQIVSYSYERYGDTLWSDVARYGVRRPYVFYISKYLALRKLAGTSVKGLYRDTFGELIDFWEAADTVADSSRRISPPAKLHTLYEHPQYLPDGRILALHGDMGHVQRFVAVSAEDGSEQRMRHTGSVSSRPVSDGGRVWWTEYRRSKLFEERVNSRLCFMELADGKMHTVPRIRNALYPTPAGDSLAWIEYRADGRYLLAVAADGRPSAGAARVEMPQDKEIHGLAWDDVTRRLYALVTDDSGMWIAALGSGGSLEPVTEGAYITLSNLRAGGGRLYFGSIASGKDEAHTIDLRDTLQQRITSSRYGAFAPAPSADGERVVVTQYARDGYHLAVQSMGSLREVAKSQTPLNVVNPPRRKWPVVNLDTVRYTPADSAASQQMYRPKRYRRALNLFNVHSWMPLSTDIFAIMDEHQVTANLGATVLSQNLLSTMQACASYGWNAREGSMVTAGLRYSGLGVRLSADFRYGGEQTVYSVLNGGSSVALTPAPQSAHHWSLSLGASLPLLFDDGYHVRQLSLSSWWSYSNGLIVDVGRLPQPTGTGESLGFQVTDYACGLQKLTFSAAFSDNVRMARRDFLPRWGYAVAADYAVNPTNSRFSDVVSLYGRVYLPGVAQHHSLSIAGAWQTSPRMMNGRTPLFGYKSSRLIPEGYSSADIVADRYTALSAAYRLPICYPDGGIPSIVYFTRIRLGAGFDYAQFRYGGSVRRLWSYGLEAAFDVNLLRMPSSGATTLTVKLYRTRHGRTSFSAGIGLPF